MSVDQEKARLAVDMLLRAIGEDPTRPGLEDTPARVARWFTEFLDADHGNVAVMFDTEGESYDEMVVLRGVRFASLCEHHLLPFTGVATVGYVPGKGGVIGLSKLARIVRVHASRLQVQERLANDIADQVERITEGLGVGVVLRATHLCATIRGVRAEGTEFVTSSLRGVFLAKPEARAEFLALARGA